MTCFWCFFVNFEHISQPVSGVCFVNFEQLIVFWAQSQHSAPVLEKSLLKKLHKYHEPKAIST